MDNTLNTITTGDALIPEKRPIPILLFFKEPIPSYRYQQIPVNTESDTWTGKTGF